MTRKKRKEKYKETVVQMLYSICNFSLVLACLLASNVGLASSTGPLFYSAL